MVKLAQNSSKLAGYSLLECLLTILLLQALIWNIWPSLQNLHLRWQAQQVLRQIYDAVEWARWTSLIKHQTFAIQVKDQHLEIIDSQNNTVKSSPSWNKKIHVRWHGFQVKLPLVFDSELSELRLNGTWDIFIKNQQYRGYVMNRLGHGRVEG